MHHVHTTLDGVEGRPPQPDDIRYIARLENTPGYMRLTGPTAKAGCTREHLHTAQRSARAQHGRRPQFALRRAALHHRIQHLVAECHSKHVAVTACMHHSMHVAESAHEQ